jgi:hypothetical protein
MSTHLPSASGPEEIARSALSSLSAAFHDRDLDTLVGLFSRSPGATYAGSEAGEIATGGQQLAELFSHLFSRPERYRFTFDDVRACGNVGGIWVLADGHGHEAEAGGEETVFPYRLAGVLTGESGRWVWAMLSGAEPTSPN